MKNLLKSLIIALPLVIGTPTCNQKSDINKARFHPDSLDARLRQEIVVSPLRRPIKENIDDYYLKIARNIKARDYKIGIFQKEYMPSPNTSDLEEEALKDTLFLDALATFIFTRQDNTDTLKPMMNPLPYIEVKVYGTNLNRNQFLEFKYSLGIKLAVEEAIKQGYVIAKDEKIKNVLVQYPFHFGVNTILAKRDKKTNY